MARTKQKCCMRPNPYFHCPNPRCPKGNYPSGNPNAPPPSFLRTRTRTICCHLPNPYYHCPNPNCENGNYPNGHPYASPLAYQAKESNVAELQRMHDGNNNASAIDLTGESEDAAQHPSSMIKATPKRSHSRIERQLKDPPEHLLNTASSKKYRRKVLASHTSGEDDESEAIICGNDEEDPAEDSDEFLGQLIHSLEEKEETEREDILREIQEWEENVKDEIMRGNSISEINQAAAPQISFQRPILKQPIAHKNQLAQSSASDRSPVFLSGRPVKRNQPIAHQNQLVQSPASDRPITQSPSPVFLSGRPVKRSRCARPSTVTSPMPSWITFHPTLGRSPNKKPTFFLSECALSIVLGRPHVCNIAITPQCLQSLERIPFLEEEPDEEFCSGVNIKPKIRSGGFKSDIDEIAFTPFRAGYRGFVDELESEMFHTREWFAQFGFLMSRLNSFHELTLIKVQTDHRLLETFWGEVADSPHLYKLKLVHIDVTKFDEAASLFDAPRLRAVIFDKCIIPNDIGYILASARTSFLDNPPNRYLTTIAFKDCVFRGLDCSKDYESFASNMAALSSIQNFHFESCNHEQKGRIPSSVFVDFMNDSLRGRNGTKVSTGIFDDDNN